MVIKNGKTMKCLPISRSSHRRCSVKKVALKNFLQACNFIKTRLQHRCFPVKLLITSFFYKTHPVVASGIIPWTLFLFIWDGWMVPFRGTYWLSCACFILLRVFRFFLFLSFLLIFLWMLLLFGFKKSFPILKIKHWSCS